MKIIRRIWGFIVVASWKLICCIILGVVMIPLLYLYSTWQILKQSFTTDELKVDTLWVRLHAKDFHRLLDKIEAISEII